MTNASGEFNVPYLPVGAYSVTVTMKGFEAATVSGLVLQVDKTINLPFALQVGATTQSVEVTAGSPLLDTSTSSLGQVINNQEIVNLPLNGRDVWDLGLLSGYSVPLKGVSTNLPFIAGGGRFQSNNILLDGIDDNILNAGGGGIGTYGINDTPSVDAIQEFKVETNNFSAEFGQSAGAIVSATTKSGTNQINGDAWEFLRNDVLDANNFFSNAAGVPLQPYTQNQFGFTLGGPIVIPKIYNGHDQTFFFVDYEGLRLATTASSSVEDIPPVAFRKEAKQRTGLPRQFHVV